MRPVRLALASSATIALVATFFAAAPAASANTEADANTNLKVPAAVAADLADGNAEVVVTLDKNYSEDELIRLFPDIDIDADARRAPYAALSLNPEDLRTLEVSGIVERIGENHRFYPATGTSVPLIGGNSTRAANMKGAGQTIAIIDTGVDKTHPALAGRVVQEYCISSTLCPNGDWFQSGPGSATPCVGVGCDHGTHVAGIAAGNTASAFGVAPAASIMSVRASSIFGGQAVFEYIDILDALYITWSARDTLKVAAVNVSLGGLDKYTSNCDAVIPEMFEMVKQLKSARIPTVVATGNDAWTDGVNDPACLSNVIAVGSTTKTDTVSAYSNSSNLVTVLAPGQSITSAIPGTGYATMSGTSMAAPHVAGTIALIKQKNSTVPVDQIITTLKQSGPNINDPRNGVARTRINAYAAVSSTVTTPYAATLDGYYIADEWGSVYEFGEAAWLGDMGSTALAQPIITMATTTSKQGYWLAASDGGIFSFGDAQFFGSTGNIALWQPIVGMTPTPSGKGYWMVASDGGIFSFGDATFYGSMGGTKLNKPIVGMSATPTGKGYWMVASDGGLFSFGDAKFFGSTGALNLWKPVVGMTPTPTGKGYWMVASDGGIFSFGDAQFYGSTGNIALWEPIVGMTPAPDGKGYWFVAADGGLFNFGSAKFHGSAAEMAGFGVVAMAS